MFTFSGITNYHRQLRANEIQCEDVVKFYLQQIRAKGDLNAFIEVFEHEALATARLLDSKRNGGRPMKKLHGVVISIKDVICYRGHRVSASSEALKNFTSLFTASALQYLIDEEAIIIGRCNCDEFAMGSSNENSAWGPVLNAHHKEYVPGGSSGGSAVAVQADLCMLSIGSDTGGSVRQPADFCGIIGFKPGYGRISRHGLIAYASSFDQIGVLGKYLDDVSLVSAVMSGPDEYDSTLDRTIKADFENAKHEEGEVHRLCYFRQMLDHPGLDPEIRKKITQTFDTLRQSGHVVDELEFELLDYLVPAYYLLTTAEASSNLSRYDGIRYGKRAEKTADLNEFYSSGRSRAFGKEVKRRIMLGTFVLSAGYYDTYFKKAQQVRRMLKDQTESVFSRYDAILLPVSPTTAFRIGEKQKDPVAMYLADIYTVFANLAGIPAMAVPLASHSNGMPFGMQIMSARKKESLLLKITGMLTGLKKN